MRDRVGHSGPGLVGGSGYELDPLNGLVGALVRGVDIETDRDDATMAIGGGMCSDGRDLGAVIATGLRPTRDHGRL